MIRLLVQKCLATDFVTYWRILFALILALLLYLTLTPQMLSPIHFSHIDKLYHLLAFAGLSFAFRAAFAKLSIFTIVFGSTVIGIVIEFIQYFIPNRGFSVADMVADLLGAILGVAVYRYFKHFSAASHPS